MGLAAVVVVVVDAFFCRLVQEMQGFDLGQELLLMMDREGGSGLVVMFVLITHVRCSVLLPHDVAEMGLDYTMGDTVRMIWPNGFANAKKKARKIVDHYFLVEQWGSDIICHLQCQPCSSGS